MPLFLTYALCAFASSVALRLMDPIVLPVAHFFAVTPAAAAMLTTAYALPYALAQPFLGPLGDRFGKTRCIQICMTGVSVMLVLGALAPTFELLMASRVFAGIFAGGLVPLVLAGLGDAYDMSERQVMIGRMLFAIIAGQMLGSVLSGLAGETFGWRSPLIGAAVLAAVVAAIAWRAMPVPLRSALPAVATPVRALYARVFENPKATWLYASVFLEGALFFGLFPYIGGLLVERTGALGGAVASRTGFVIGAFGIGGLLYAFAVRTLIRSVGVRRMCQIASIGAALCYAALAFMPFWWLDALAMFGAGLCFYMLHNSMQTEATELAPSARGSAVALFACGLFSGQGVGPLLFGSLIHGAGFGVTLLVVGVALVLLGQLVVRQVIDRNVGGAR